MPTKIMILHLLFYRFKSLTKSLKSKYRSPLLLCRGYYSGGQNYGAGGGGGGVLFDGSGPNASDGEIPPNEGHGGIGFGAGGGGGGNGGSGGNGAPGFVYIEWD